MTIELVIFDCDGVLVDSEPVSARILAEALVELGLDVTPAGVDEEYRGRSISDIVKDVERRLGKEVPPDFATLLAQQTREAFQHELRPVDGVLDVLEGLATRGIDMCVASSGTLEKIEHSLQLTHLQEFFEDRIFSAAQVDRGKPAPDLFLFAMQSMGHSPRSTVVIEDSLPGVTGALAAGARVLGYVPVDLPRGAEHEQAIVALGAEPFSNMRRALDLMGMTER